jgi:hypothetical protein
MKFYAKSSLNNSRQNSSSAQSENIGQSILELHFNDPLTQ